VTGNGRVRQVGRVGQVGQVGLVGLGLMLMPAMARAQDAPELRAHHVTISGGVMSSGQYDVGESTAQLRGNAPGATAPPFTLFTTDAHISRATGPELKVGFAITSRILFEAGGSVSRPRIGVAIAGDAEAPAQELPGEQLQQYFFDASVTWQLPIRLGRRLAPFVVGGGGYLRQLHEERTLGEAGQIYYAGGGARYFLRGGHDPVRPIGIRGDVRVNVRRKGIDFEDRMRTFPSFSLLLFVGL
jgi:hypothetical protein